VAVHVDDRRQFPVVLEGVAVTASKSDQDAAAVCCDQDLVAFHHDHLLTADSTPHKMKTQTHTD